MRESAGDAMRELPTGTVTFLFTDLETSTRLWEGHPDEMRRALDRHDEILRGAIEGHDGVVFSEMGDGMAAAFSSAPSALHACLDIQRALAVEPWPEPAVLRVRMGLHAGEGELRSEHQYVNAPLNRCARLMAVAHGGQIVCSDTVEPLVRDALPDDVSLFDLGVHRLRDLAQPMRIFQVVHPALASEFPGLRSLEVHTNLPVQLTSFVGREREISELCAALTSSRIVTLTGVGGVGKTRLAQQVAADALPDFPDGAWVVALAPVADPDVVAESIATALDLSTPVGIPPETVIVEDLRRRKLLLVLDNCEHVLDRAAQIATSIGQHCPDVVILATSREGLAVPGERLFAVTALPLPEEHASFEALADSDAVQLFVDRASAARHDFRLSAENADSVAAVCRRLDGVPLALELAAARVTALHPSQIATRLDERFRLLNAGRRGAVERHQTLRATIDWSYDLLTPSERIALNRLAVFAGGCTLDAAEAVIADGDIDAFEVLDLLARLVEQSLVIADDAGSEQRYRLLETIRQYAAERLADARDTDATRARHASFYRSRAAQIGPGLAGPNESAWFDVYDIELENLRTAVDWFVQQDDADAALGLVFSMYPLLLFDPTQSIVDLVALATTAPSAPHHQLGPSALIVVAEKLVQAGDVEAGTAAIAVAAASQVEMPTEPHPTAFICEFRIAMIAGDPERGRASAAALLERDDVRSNPLLYPWALNGLGAWLMYLDETEDAIAAMREALVAAMSSKNPSVITMVANALGWAIRDTEPAESRRLLDTVIDLDGAVTDVSLPLAYANRAILNAREQRWSEAVSDGRISIKQIARAHDRATVFSSLGHLSIALAELGRSEAAVTLYAAAQVAIPISAHPAYGWHRIADRVMLSLGTATFESARIRGESLGRDEAEALVLTELDSVEAELGAAPNA